MGEINEREAELNAARDRLLEQDEEMREISVQREKIAIERDYLTNELKVMTQRMQDLQVKYNDQARLLLSVTAHTKNPASNNTHLMNSSQLDDAGQLLSPEEVAREESMRADRIARQINRSSFMPLGENPPKLYSEQDPTQKVRGSMAGPGSGGVFGVNSVFQDKDHSYLTDDSVPASIYALIDTYR